MCIMFLLGWFKGQKERQVYYYHEGTLMEKLGHCFKFYGFVLYTKNMVSGPHLEMLTVSKVVQPTNVLPPAPKSEPTTLYLLNQSHRQVSKVSLNIDKTVK